MSHEGGPKNPKESARTQLGVPEVPRAEKPQRPRDQTMEDRFDQPWRNFLNKDELTQFLTVQRLKNTGEACFVTRNHQIFSNVLTIQPGNRVMLFDEKVSLLPESMERNYHQLALRGMMRQAENYLSADEVNLFVAAVEECHLPNDAFKFLSDELPQSFVTRLMQHADAYIAAHLSEKSSWAAKEKERAERVADVSGVGREKALGADVPPKQYPMPSRRRPENDARIFNTAEQGEIERARRDLARRGSSPKAVPFWQGFKQGVKSFFSGGK